MPKIAPPTGGDYPELPEKEWIKVSIKSVTPFNDEKFPAKDGTPKPRFEIVFEAVDPDFAGTHIWAYAGQSWHEKSNLRKIAQATFPADLADADLFEVDTDDLVAKELFVMGEYDPDDTDHKFLKPKSYKRIAATPAPRGAARPAARAAAAAAKPAAKADDGEIDI